MLLRSLASLALLKSLAPQQPDHLRPNRPTTAQFSKKILEYPAYVEI